MPLLSKIEACSHLGVSHELLTYFTKYCPKYKETRKLLAKKVGDEEFFETAELDDYLKYLEAPWPMSKKDNRPRIPEAIKEEIKREAHFGCAICGHMDNGEVAHIKPVATTMCNSPTNLIYLCPNHHTKYDFGFKPGSNVTLDEINAAKILKINSKRRILRYEANATRSLIGLTKFISSLEKSIKESHGKAVSNVFLTEMRLLLKELPSLANLAEEQAKRDKDISNIDKTIAKIAPTLAKAASLDLVKSTESQVRSVANSVIDTASKVILDLDEEDCPRCNGTGTKGLVGSFCAFCKGSCFVTKAQAAAYEPEVIEDLDCHRCNGAGRTGLVGDICAYCNGECLISSIMAEEYDEDSVDEEECPHCNGSGQTGRVGDICSFCKGSCFVSSEKSRSYNRDDLDEVECPHCNGSGQTGRVGDICAYCKGSCVVTTESAADYRREDIDEVDCPHCHGSGQTGRVGDICIFCKGSCVVSKAKAQSYDRDELGEVDCPKCNGSGQQGLVGDLCTLCKGSCVVDPELAEAYKAKYG